MSNDFNTGKPRTIKANHLLQAKVGSGDVAPEKVAKMQSVMDNNKTDYAPMANDHLDRLALAISRARQGTSESPGKNSGNGMDLIDAMIEPVMQLKGNASMFNYPLVGNLANIMMNLLENIDTLDDTVIDIVDAHHKTLSVIVKNKMTGSGGDYGMQLESELSDACKRYFSKRGVNPLTSNDAFFID